MHSLAYIINYIFFILKAITQKRVNLLYKLQIITII